MVEIAISIAGKVAEMVVTPIWRQISYPFKYNTNMTELKKQVQKLMYQRELVQHSVDAAKRQGDEIEKLVADWMKSVDEFADKVVTPIIDAEEKVGGKLCFNMRSRYSLSRKAVKARKDGISLLGDGTFQKVSYRCPIQRMNSLWIKGFEDFASRMPVFEKIMDALSSADVNLIGVWGMGGVGKTTLVKKVASRAIEAGLFGKVVFVEVSQTVDVEKLQERIADELDMELHKGSVSRKATQLRQRLKDETSILLILDNIWEKLDLDALGIPVWNDLKKSVEEEIEPDGKIASNRKVKLLLTSRDLDVLHNDMNSQNNFFLDTLSNSEASSLFWNTVNSAEKEADFDLIATEIVRKCAGLPIAIITIASALKNKDLSFWKDALRWLRKSNPKPIKGMEKSVYSTIELSYKVLGIEEQSLFLLCALDESGFGSWTNDLIKYSMGLNLFENVDTIEDVRIRMHTLISILKDSCLLLDAPVEGLVKMHDIIHAVAISIASSDKLMFNIPSGARIREMLEDKLPKASTMVSYQHGDIMELPEVLEFPNLKMFRLSSKEQVHLQISDTLFDKVKELRVMHLTKFNLSYLPSSLVGLTNLRTLCLDGCLFGDVAIIGELNKLEILNFAGSEIERLPKEIGQLNRLRVLDLTFCSKLKVIAANVLSNLTRLEELYMGNSFVQWEVDGQQNASLSELKKLSNLTSLEIQVLEANIIPPDLYFGELKNYKIFIGDVWEWSEKRVTTAGKMLKLKLNSSFHLIEGIKVLLKEVEDLHLDEPKGVNNVLQALNVEGFQRLKNLHIQNAPQIQCISSKSSDWGLCSILPRKLESLVLQNLINLDTICRDRVEAESFGQLRVIKIEKCDNLKHLILPIAGHLSQLQKIKVSKCSKVEEIIFVGGRDLHNDNQQNRRIELTELRSVELRLLPNLSRFGFITSEDDPESFKSFFDPNVLLPNLEKLELCSIDFRCCESIAVTKCLFSLSMVRSLSRLQKLMISNCEMVEAIFDTEESIEEETSVEKIFPSLKILNLDDLPKLTRFCFNPSLEENVSLSSLIILRMHSISLTVLWHNQLLGKSFYLRNMRHLLISHLDDLKYLFTSSMVNSLPQLIFIEIKNCKLMEVVVVTEEKRSTVVEFPSLEFLYLHDLPKLRRFSEFTTVDLSSLSEFWIMNCPEMQTFVSHSHSISMLPSTECSEIDLGDDFQDNTLPFFDEKVKLSGLKELKLELMDNLRKIWQDQLYQDSFSILEMLLVRGCHNISSVFPLNMLGRLHTLHELQVKECDLVEKIFEAEGLGGDRTHDTAAPKLKILSLEKLPKLKHVWNMDSRVSLSFQNLQELRVDSCENLKSLFPAIIAKGLEQLEKLFVRSCMMEEIIAKEDSEAVSEFIFPQLRSLKLSYLSRLKGFCSGSYISKWPKLEKLTVWECSEVKILALERKSNTENHCNVSNGGPLFLVDKAAFPALNSMELNWKCLANEMLYGRFLEYSHKLNSLQLRGPYTENPICPSCFFSRLSNIISLAIFEGYLKELLLHDGFVCMGEHSELPSKLSSLQLGGLTDQFFWNIHPEFDRLAQNLTALEVYHCNELLNLVASSTAKSLKQLTRLGIFGCEKIEEIILDVEEAIDDCMVFSQLKTLALYNLPNLAMFYSGSCKIEFTCLQEVHVIECPNMRRFSRRDLSAPRLHTLRIGDIESGGGPIGDIENEGCWEGDLNTSIEQQYLRKNGQ